MTLKASDFVFGIGADETDPDMLGVAITSKSHFDTEGHMECVHMADEIAAFWPAGVEMDEVQEGFFLIGEEMTRAELQDEFVNAGFIHSPALEALFV